MRILLINPPRVYEKGEEPFLVFPLGLGYLAASISDYDVQVLDCIGPFHNMINKDDEHIVHGLPLQNILERIEEIDPDIVLISVSFSNQHEIILSLLDDLRKVSARMKVILGGPHPSAIPEEFLREKLADYVVIGEGELVLPRLLRNIEGQDFSDMRSVAYLRDGGVVVDRQREVFEDIDLIRFPAWEMFDMEAYIGSGRKHTRRDTNRRVIEIITSRGCPQGCMYCASRIIFGDHFRKRSVENIFDEIDILIRRYSVQEVHILDDNILLDKERFRKICRGLGKRKLMWSLPNGVSLDLMDGKTLDLMARCGCDSLYLAVETINHDVLGKYSTKRISPRKAQRIIARANSYGMWTVGFFLIGFPEENIASIRRTVDFAAGCGLDDIHLSILTPLPGTSISIQKVKGEYANLNAKRVNIVTLGLQPDEIIHCRNIGYIKFEMKKLWREKLAYFSGMNLRRLNRYFNYLVRSA